MATDWQDLLAFTHSLANRVGSRLLEDFGSVTAEEKADGSLVTAADRWADEQIYTAIAEAFSTHGILSEESQHLFPATEWCWVVDPLDGTTNFSRGIPLWGTSIALLRRGTPVFGYVHLPPIGQTFHGFWLESDPITGAYLTRQDRQIAQRLRPSLADPGPNQLFNFCSRSTRFITPDFPCKARMLGGAAYNMLLVGAGTFLGAVERSPKIWDIAAVWAILRAAGTTWIPLDNQDPFPLVPNANYERHTYPTLIVSQERLGSLFRPLIS